MKKIVILGFLKASPGSLFLTDQNLVFLIGDNVLIKKYNDTWQYEKTETWIRPPLSKHDVYLKVIRTLTSKTL